MCARDTAEGSYEWTPLSFFLRSAPSACRALSRPGPVQALCTTHFVVIPQWSPKAVPYILLVPERETNTSERLSGSLQASWVPIMLLNQGHCCGLHPSPSQVWDPPGARYRLVPMSLTAPSLPFASLLDQGRKCEDIHLSSSGLSSQDQRVRWAWPWNRGALETGTSLYSSVLLFLSPAFPGSLSQL